jgi:hypothetical protein
MDRTSACVLGAAVIVGLATHGGLLLLAAREAPNHPRPNAAAATPAGSEDAEARAEDQRRDALREKEGQEAAAQRHWERVFWEKVFDEARFLVRNKPPAGKYQVVRVEGKDVFVFDTTTGQVAKRPLPE